MASRRELVTHLAAFHDYTYSPNRIWRQLIDVHMALHPEWQHPGWSPGPGWDLTEEEAAEVLRASSEAAALRNQMMTGDPALIGDGIREIVTLVNDWLDGAVADTYQDQPMAQDWARVAKCAEEISEVMQEAEGRELSAHDRERLDGCTLYIGRAIEALIAVTGQNPRKGVCGTLDEMLKELADVWCTAIFAIQHFTNDSEVTASILAASLGKAMRRATEAQTS
jgi:hypothetical protein